MEFEQVVKNRRTRRKYINKKVPHEKLVKLVEYARFAPMGINLQGLKYAIIDDEELVKKVFPLTVWSALRPQNAPKEHEQPTSYIAMIGDLNIKPNGDFETDAGAAGTIITLGAENLGLFSCWLGSIDKPKISELLNLSDNYDLLYLIAVGYSEQKATYVDAENEVMTYIDVDGVLTVPKRKVEDILISI